MDLLIVLAIFAATALTLLYSYGLGRLLDPEQRRTP